MFGAKKNWTLDRSVAFYIDDCMARGHSPRTLEAKKSALGFFIRWCKRQGLIRVDRVRIGHLEQYRRYLCRYRQPFNNRQLDLATQRNRLTAIKVFLRQMKKYNLITADPATDFELPRVGRRLPKGILNTAEVESIFAAIPSQTQPGLRDRAILETYYATGKKS